MTSNQTVAGSIPARVTTLRPGSSRIPALAAFAIALPALATGVLVYRYGVDVPTMDEWIIARLLSDVQSGTVTAATFFEQHNEHRPVVVRVIELAQAWIGGWNLRVTMGLTFGLIATMLCGCLALWRQSGLAIRPGAVVAMAAASMLLFSPAQHHNLMWAFQFCFYVSPAAVLASVIAAWSNRLSLRGALGCAAVCCGLATYSLLAGTFTWPLAAAAIMLARGLPGRRTAMAWTVWAITAGLVIGSYFYGYVSPPNSPSVFQTLKRPLTIIVGFVACLGGPFSVGVSPYVRGGTALVSGAAVSAAFVWCLAEVARARDRVRLLESGPWIVMGGFACLVAAAMTLGRVGISLGAMINSRYTAVTIWVYVATVMLSVILRGHCVSARGARLFSWLPVVVIAMSAAAYPFQLRAIQREHQERLAALAVVTFAEVASTGWPAIPQSFDSAHWAFLTSLLQRLEQTGWRTPRPAAPAWVETMGAPGECRFGVVESLSGARGRTTAQGWAFLSEARRPADAVLATTGRERRLVGLVPLTRGRPEITERLGLVAGQLSGWSFDVTSESVQPPLRFWALDVLRMEAYPLCEVPPGVARLRNARAKKAT